MLGLPRVALLFLSRGQLHHERLWAEWLADIEGMLPRQYLQVCPLCTAADSPWMWQGARLLATRYLSM